MAQLTEVFPEVPTERTAIIVFFLVEGRTFRTAEVASLVGVSRQGAYDLMARISRVLPLALDDGTWRFVRIEERVCKQDVGA